MKTLTEYNKEKENIYKELYNFTKPKKNGIACPNCGDELYDSEPYLITASIPPKTKVECKKCGYKDYRII